MAEHEEVLVNEEVNYEESDINTRLLLGSVILLVVVTACSMMLSLWIFNSLETRQVQSYPTPLPLIELRPTPPQPRLQPNALDRSTAEEDMETMNAREDAILDEYGWVDEDEGIVRIPIDRAIDILGGEIEEEPGR